MKKDEITHYAKRALTALVAHAQNYSGGSKWITYGELAKRIEFPQPYRGSLFANRIGRVLGRMGHMFDGRKIDGQDIPPIEALAVKSSNKLPSDGLKEFFPSYPRLSTEEKRDLINRLYRTIYSFGSRWDRLLRELELEPAPLFQENSSRRRGRICWRMSFRIGNQGESLWKDCLKKSIAIITYSPLHSVDLAKFPKFQPSELWDQLGPTQKFSLEAVAYEMKEGDIIYAKEGPSIVAKGTVIHGYKFDSEILGRKDVDWGHFVKVDWTDVVAEDQIRFVGPAQNTVHELRPDEILLLEDQIAKLRKKPQPTQYEVLEGRATSCHRRFKIRDRKIIEIKKHLSDYRCEICSLNFEERYGKIGHQYIVVHHLKPIGARKRASRTTLDELILVCSNCHVMLHKRRPPYTPEELGKALRHQEK